jgi:diguanylate cyclase (GGDEF)-like protein
LTGLANRKALFDLLEAGQTHGALLFCDLDRFKPVNDRYGHAAGDRVLRQIAQRMRAAVREGDLVARAGGDEFVVVARDATPEQVAALAQRIRSAVAEPTQVGDDEVIVGVTIGVAHADGALDESTLAGADEALMAAKANGRGTVRWAPDHPPTDPERDTWPDQHL